MTISKAPLFRDVYQEWLADGINRNLDPFRPATAKTYKSQIETNVLPVIGDLPIDVVGNKAVNSVVKVMVAGKLSPATISLNINLIKDIRAFLKNDDGPLYPVQWDAKIIDAPKVNKRTQKTPKANAQLLQAALKCTSTVPNRAQALLALLAGSGMRIQEALALRLDPDDGVSTVWIPSESKIVIRGQRLDDGVFAPTKTEAGFREVDLPAELNNFLGRSFKQQFIEQGEGNDVGEMFPESEGYYRREFVKCNIIGGFHSLRRFRITFLRLQGVPDSLIKFWVGHEDGGVTGRYTEVGQEIEARKVQAARAGLGFTLPEAA